MIKSASQYPVHTLLGHEGNLQYRIPPYQREYSWQKAEWEYLFQDLVESDGAHFLGTIITLNQTEDAAAKSVLELIDGQQRMTTLTLLLAAIYSILAEHKDELDDDERTDLVNLGRRLVRRQDGEPRVIPQTQGRNRDDYVTVLSDAGMNIASARTPYFTVRRISKCFEFFKAAIAKMAEENGCGEAAAALRMLAAVNQAVIVKIEVASHADAFVLFESLNNRGMPLTPVDLIKNHLLAEAERKNVMNVDDAFKRWNEMLTNLGDAYATHERFLRHYYNAFKSELPEVTNAPVATKSRLIRIYELLLADGIEERVEALIAASKIYGRITGSVAVDNPSPLDRALRRLTHSQGAPSYVLLMWMLSKDGAEDDDTVLDVVDRLTSFFVRRNLTGFPPTYALPKLFMDVIGTLEDAPATPAADVVSAELASASASDETFRERLLGPIYQENTDVTRFVLAALAESAMTKETSRDLWARENEHFVWTIEHVFPQGDNIPEAWQEMLGGAELAAAAHQEHVHRLGNLTITAYNSNLGNKSFTEKRDRTDAAGRYIGYKNGLSLNADLAEREAWTVADIEARTASLANQVIAHFPLG